MRTSHTSYWTQETIVPTLYHEVCNVNIFGAQGYY